MTRQDRVYNWLDRQVDRVTTDNYKVKRLAAHTADLTDRTEAILMLSKLGKHASKDAIRKQLKKSRYNAQRMDELGTAMNRKENLSSRDMIMAPRLNRIARDSKVLEANKKKIDSMYK